VRPAAPPQDTATTARLLQRGLSLAYLTLGWNVVGVVIVVTAAVAARSVALAGFGLDALIEIFASAIVVWQLTGVNQHRERRALRLMDGGPFSLLPSTSWHKKRSPFSLASARRPREEALRGWPPPCLPCSCSPGARA